MFQGKPTTFSPGQTRKGATKVQLGGTLASLTRTESSGFTLEQSITFEEIETQLQEETFELMSAVSPLSHLPEIILESAIARRWCQGQRIAEFTFDHLAESQIALILGEKLPLRVHREDGEFLGIGLISDTEIPILIPKMVFAQMP